MDTVDLKITLTVDQYRAIAELLEADYPHATSVQSYFQWCADDVAREAQRERAA